MADASLAPCCQHQGVVLLKCRKGSCIPWQLVVALLYVLQVTAEDSKAFAEQVYDIATSISRLKGGLDCVA